MSKVKLIAVFRIAHDGRKETNEYIFKIENSENLNINEIYDILTNWAEKNLYYQPSVDYRSLQQSLDDQSIWKVQISTWVD